MRYPVARKKRYRTRTKRVFLILPRALPIWRKPPGTGLGLGDLDCDPLEGRWLECADIVQEIAKALDRYGDPYMEWVDRAWIDIPESERPMEIRQS